MEELGQGPAEIAQDAAHAVGAAYQEEVKAGLTPGSWQAQLTIFAQQHIDEWEQQGIVLGEDIVAGIESGLLNEQQALDLQAILIAEGVIGAFSDTLQTNSPSLVMFGIGQDVMFGLYDGIQAQVNPLQALLDSIVLQFVQFGINISSTIRPVYTELQMLQNFISTTLAAISTNLSTTVNSLFSGGFPATTNNNTTQYNTYAPSFANVGHREYSANQSMYSQWINSGAVG